MSDQPVYTRKSPISYRRFAEKDLRSIIDVIAAEYDAGKDVDGYRNFTFEVDYADSTSNKVENGRPVDGDELFAKPISRLEARLTLPDDKRISLKITAGNATFPGSNSLSVSGHDRTWVDGVTVHVLDVVQSAASQPHYQKYSFLVACFIAVIYWAIIFALRQFITSVPWQLLPLIWGVVSVVVIIFIDNRVNDMWPRIEIQIGREHANRAAQLRNRAWVWFSAILVPILASLVPIAFTPAKPPEGIPTRPPLANESVPLTPSAVFKLSAFTQLPQIRPGQLETVEIRIVNVSDSIIPEAYITAESPGFEVRDGYQVFRFIPAHEERAGQVSVQVDKDVPAGSYDVGITAQIVRSNKAPLTAVTETHFTVE